MKKVLRFLHLKLKIAVYGCLKNVFAQEYMARYIKTNIALSYHIINTSKNPDKVYEAKSDLIMWEILQRRHRE